ncbi:MAG: hypothetical protein IPM83_08655 [Ignavibacteria bacterium]|nr:hypothetical protein [Ignavibacteria bacterium]
MSTLSTWHGKGTFTDGERRYRTRTFTIGYSPFASLRAQDLTLENVLCECQFGRVLIGENRILDRFLKGLLDLLGVHMRNVVAAESIIDHYSGIIPSINGRDRIGSTTKQCCTGQCERIDDHLTLYVNEGTGPLLIGIEFNHLSVDHARSDHGIPHRSPEIAVDHGEELIVARGIVSLGHISKTFQAGRMILALDQTQGVSGNRSVHGDHVHDHRTGAIGSVLDIAYSRGELAFTQHR